MPPQRHAQASLHSPKQTWRCVCWSQASLLRVFNPLTPCFHTRGLACDTHTHTHTQAIRARDSGADAVCAEAEPVVGSSFIVVIVVVVVVVVLVIVGVLIGSVLHIQQARKLPSRPPRHTHMVTCSHTLLQSRVLQAQEGPQCRPCPRPCSSSCCCPSSYPDDASTSCGYGTSAALQPVRRKGITRTHTCHSSH